MKTLTSIMSHKSKEEYLESCRLRYRSRGRAGKSAMIDEVIDTLGWTRKHTIKALRRQVSLGKKSQKRGSKLTHGKVEQDIIVGIWKQSEQPCGIRLKATIPLWLDSYTTRHGKIGQLTKKRILKYSASTLDRIIAPHRLSAQSTRKGRRTGRSSNRIKTYVPIRCGPQEFDEPGWLEVDTVSHGGGSSSGAFLWSLTTTDFYSGWTELSALWGNSGAEVCVALERIEKRLPFDMLGFDCDNGSEFLNETFEAYLLWRKRSIVWTRSRAYKKNDQAHVEQKNFTHVRQLLGYGRIADLALKNKVEDLYAQAWLPLRNYYTPVMKLIKKQRIGNKVHKTYDTPTPPCDRLLACPKVSETIKEKLRQTKSKLDPIALAEEVEIRLKEIFEQVERHEEERWEEMERAGETPINGQGGKNASVGDGVTTSVANAPSVSTPSPTEKPTPKTTQKNKQQTKCRVS